MCTDYDILTKLSIAIVAAMPAKLSRDPSHLVAAVGSSSSAVVWTDPGGIDLQTAHGSSLSPRRSSNRRRDNSCSTESVRLGDTCTPYLAVRGGRGTAWKSSIRQTVDLLQSEDRRGRPSSCTRWTLMAILLQGRGSSEDRLPGCPTRRATQAQTAHGLLHPQGQCHCRVATEALGGSVQWNQAVVRANSVELYSQGAVHLMCLGPAYQ